jgi:hypothetical protein
MALCAIKATPASALPTATCGYVGDPKGGGISPGTEHRCAYSALKAPSTGHQYLNLCLCCTKSDFWLINLQMSENLRIFAAETENQSVQL